MRALVLFPATACVVAYDERVEIREDVDRIEIRLGSGDVRVTAGPGPVVLEGSFGGFGGDVDHHVDDGVLVIDQDCPLCGGELELRAPARTVLDVELGSGALVVTGLRGRLTADVGAGSIDVREHGAAPVTLVTATGDVSASFASVPEAVEVVLSTGDATVEVPAGGYALDLHAQGGAITVEGVVDDPGGPPIVVHVAVGAIRVSAD